MAEVKEKQVNKAGTKKKSTSSSTKTTKSVAKTTTKKGASTKKTSTSKGTSTKKNAKKRKPQIELNDLETREADLQKTVIIKKEELEELQSLAGVKKEDAKIEDIKIESKRESKKPAIAKTILGVEMPSEMTKDDRSLRRKLYAKDALMFAIIVPIIDLLAMISFDNYTYLIVTSSVALNYLITLILDFLLIFFATFAIDYLFGEDNVKKLNK